MTGIIQSYDQGKGKGIFSAGGQHIPFTYKQFSNERMIAPGEPAEMIDNRLYPVYPGWWVGLILKIKGVFKWL